MKKQLTQQSLDFFESHNISFHNRFGIRLKVADEINFLDDLFIFGFAHYFFCTNEVGRQACIQSGAPSALTSLAHLKTCPVLAKTSVANAFRAITGKELVILH